MNKFTRNSWILSNNQKKVIQLLSSSDEDLQRDEQRVKQDVLNIIRTDYSNYTFSSSSVSNLSSAAFIDLVTKEDLARSTRYQFDLLKEEFLDEESCLFILIYLPLTDSDLSIMDLREEISSGLYEAQIINDEGDYNESFINEQSQEQLTLILDDCFETLYNDLGPEWKLLLVKFKSQIFNRLINIKRQESIDINIDHAHFRFITNFLMRIAKELLEEDVEISIYAAIDGLLAHNIQGTNKIKFNKKTPRFKELIKFYTEYQVSLDKDAVILNYADMILKFLITLTHEVAHIKEKSKHEYNS